MIYLARLLMLIMATLLMLVPMQGASAASFSQRTAEMGAVTAIRVNAEAGKVRIVADASREVNYETSVLSNPQRVVINLYGAWLSPSVPKTIQVGSPLVKQVRVAQFDKETVRIVVESNVSKNGYDVFSIEGGSSPYRVVMDFTNAGGSPLSSNKSSSASSSGNSNTSVSSKGGGSIDFSGTTIREKQEKDRLEAERKANEALQGSTESGPNYSYGTEDNISKKDKDKDKDKKDKDKDKKDKKDKDKAKDKTEGIRIVDQNADDHGATGPVIHEVHFTPGLKDKKICIDPGHGGSDVGAIGPTGVTEKSITFKVSQQVQKMLAEEGAQVIMTRTKDVEVSSKKANATDIEELQARCDVANKADADIFVSLHMDSYSNSTPSGTTGYYYEGGNVLSQKMAKNISDSIVNTLGTNNRGIKPCHFYVVKHTDMPATLIEIAFISNDKEEKLMSSDTGVKKAATAIVDGLKKFFG